MVTQAARKRPSPKLEQTLGAHLAICWLAAGYCILHTCSLLHCLQFYLLDDRLCYTDEPGKVEDVRYIPLDRIPVRALPRGYGPQIGVTVIEDRQAVACRKLNCKV